MFGIPRRICSFATKRRFFEPSFERSTVMSMIDWWFAMKIRLRPSGTSPSRSIETPAARRAQPATRRFQRTAMRRMRREASRGEASESRRTPRTSKPDQAIQAKKPVKKTPSRIVLSGVRTRREDNIRLAAGQFEGKLRS